MNATCGCCREEKGLEVLSSLTPQGRTRKRISPPSPRSQECTSRCSGKSHSVTTEPSLPAPPKVAHVAKSVCKQQAVPPDCTASRRLSHRCRKSHSLNSPFSSRAAVSQPSEWIAHATTAPSISRSRTGLPLRRSHNITCPSSEPATTKSRLAAAHVIGRCTSKVPTHLSDLRSQLLTD